MLGGAIVLHLDWRWIFWLNVPPCLAGLLLASRYLAPAPRDPNARLDGLGLAPLSPGVAGAVFGLSRVSAAGGFAHAQVLVPQVRGDGATTAGMVLAAQGAGMLTCSISGKLMDRIGPR